jgi:hypothetical protein
MPHRGGPDISSMGTEARRVAGRKRRELTGAAKVRANDP